MEHEKRLYRLYIDEIGSSHYPKSKEGLPFDQQYFGLCGIVMKKEEVEKLNQKFIELKKIIIDDTDEAKNIYLHRKEITSKTGKFKQLLDSEIEKLFNEKLLGIFTEIDFQIIFVGLDKINHKDRYSTPLHPYHYMMSIMVERYVGLLELLKGRGDIMAETINPNDDDILQKEYEDHVTRGSAYCSTNRIKERVTTKNIKFMKKTDCIAGLEIADLLAVPVLFELLATRGLKPLKQDTFNCKIIEVIAGKYYKYGKKLII